MASRTEEIYIPCECRVSIYFPAGHIECDICPLLQTYSRRQCMRTGELIPAWQKRGYYCPLEIPGELIPQETDDQKEDMENK